MLVHPGGHEEPNVILHKEKALPPPNPTTENSTATENSTTTNPTTTYNPTITENSTTTENSITMVNSTTADNSTTTSNSTTGTSPHGVSPRGFSLRHHRLEMRAPIPTATNQGNTPFPQWEWYPDSGPCAYCYCDEVNARLRELR
ncbi:hypothetical protein MPER_01115 [Moniliophthora perniciosa FA553]|nr:hypothetical protein MPER_01115 [Moniliophthora perniciosa FA553]